MEDDNYLLISLKDEKSKKLAQVISNDTSRKILEFLTKKDATETEIGEGLGIPLSTVHYNMQALVRSGLVKVDEFHYSEKGKEVNHYSLANKVIIIAPAGEDRWRQALRSFIPIGMFGLAATFGVFLWEKMFSRNIVGTFSTGATKAAAPLVAERVVVADEAAGAVMADEAIKGTGTASADTIVDQAVSGAGSVAETSGAMADQAMDQAAQAVAETGATAADTVVDQAANAIAAAPPGAFQAGGDALTAPSEPNLWLWFLLGTAFTLVIMVLWEFLRRKKR